MSRSKLANMIISAWRKNNEILLYLLDHIPAKGLKAVPTGSRGRDVAAQLDHVNRVRIGWVHYHKTGKRPKLPRYNKGKPPTKVQLKKALQESGRKVERFLERVLSGKAGMRLFRKDPGRWMTYLIAHDSHHRGQILLALKQANMRLPESVAVHGLWGKWVYGE